MMMMRILAILAAVLLVGAFAMATLTPPDLMLGHALIMVDHSLLVTAQYEIQRHLSPWVWDRIAVPLLLRPAWFLPVAAGLVCAGAALTLASRQAPHSRRRRS